MPKFSQKSLDQLATCHPKLQELLNEAIKYVDLVVLEGHRNEANQNKAFDEGRSQKRWPDGNHNKLPSVAVDISPYPIDFNDKERYYYFIGFIKGLATQMGIRLRCGADWDGDFDLKDQTLIDIPHIELLDI